MFSLSEPTIWKILESMLSAGTSLIRDWKIDQKRKNRTILLRQERDFDLPLCEVSHSQLAFFAIEVAREFAAFSSEYAPTLLILDDFPALLDNTNLIAVTTLLSNEIKRFQTIIAIIPRNIDYGKLLEAGANLFYLKGATPNAVISTAREAIP